jgi:hypothetical protein
MILAAFLVAVASCAVVLAPRPAAAAPCNLDLGCGTVPPDVTPIGNCLDPAICGTPDQGAAPAAGGGGGGANAPVPVDPQVVALQFPLPLIQVHTAPGGVDRGTTYAKLLTYLWLTGWRAQPFTEPQTGIRFTAKFQYASWDLAETTTKSCSTPGSATSAACSYTYRRSSPQGGRHAYPIRAFAHYAVSYTCPAAIVCTGGQTGQAGDMQVPSQTYDLKVGEMQAISTH